MEIKKCAQGIDCPNEPGNRRLLTSTVPGIITVMTVILVLLAGKSKAYDKTLLDVAPGQYVERASYNGGFNWNVCISRSDYFYGFGQLNNKMDNTGC
jgi:hypothetical protein